MKNFSVLIFLFFLFSACSSNNNEVTIDSSNYLDYDSNLNQSLRSLKLIDQIPLFDSSYYYSFLTDKELFKENKLLAIQLPNLFVNVVDTSGRFLQKITQRGNGPGLLGTTKFAHASFGNSKNIYVLGTGANYQLVVFSNDGEPLGKVFLSNYDSDISPSYYSSYYVNDENEEYLELTLSHESSNYSIRDRRFFENESGITRFTISKTDFTVTHVEKFLPFSSKKKVQNALESGNIHWQRPLPIFEHFNGNFYVVYPFSDSVFIYDSDFNLISTLELNLIKGKNLPYHEEELTNKQLDFFERTIALERLSRENLNLTRLEVEDSTVMVQFPEVLKENSYPLTKRSDLGKPIEREFKIRQNILLKNLKTNEEKWLTFDGNHYNAHLVDSQTVLFFYRSPERDDVFLNKYKILW